MHPSSTIRRLVLLAGVAMLVGACEAGASPSAAPASGSGATPAASVAPIKVSAPVTLNILDVAGNKQLSEGMINNFKAAHPEAVAAVNWTTATAPQAPGKLKAEQDANNVQTSLLLTGTDALAAGIGQNLYTKIIPDHQDLFPGLMDNYLEPAAAMAQLAQGFGIEIVYYPSGPLLEYNPTNVPTPPTTPQELLDWAKAHPGKFEYAQPANSGPGRTFLMALPYILGDKDPTDPTNGWDKTWAYLQQLSQYITVYQSGTTATMKDLAAGTVDIIASTTGWDINPRVLGTVPNTVKVTPIQPMNWVTDAQFAVIPKGVSADVLAVDLALMRWMLRPDQQAIAFDKGYFYPGPAVKGVTLAMAPKDSQDAINQFGRAEYAQWIDQYPKHTSLPPATQVIAFDLWNQKVAKK